MADESELNKFVPGLGAAFTALEQDLDARVPTPTEADGTKFLKGDGTWATHDHSGTYEPVLDGSTITGKTGVTAASDDYVLVSDTSDSGGLKKVTAASIAATGGPGGQAFPVGSVFIAVVGTDPATLLGYGTWSAFGAGRVLVGHDSGDTDFDTVEETGGAKTVASAGSVAAPTISGSTASGTTGITVDTHAAHTHGVTTNVTVSDHASHTHTYTDVPNHVHVINGFPTATGGSTGFTRDTSMSGTPADTSLSTNNPTGGVATGTTAGPSATLTHTVTNNAVTSDNPSATLTHTVNDSGHTHGAGTLAASAPAYTGSATSVVQPYIVVYMWKRTA